MAGSEAEAVEERTYWLAPHGFLSLVFVCFLFFGFFWGGVGLFFVTKTQDHLLRGSTTCCEPATSIINQENASTGQSHGEVFSVERPSPQMILASVRLTIKPSRTLTDSISVVIELSKYYFHKHNHWWTFELFLVGTVHK